jgi:hypothetical protein
VRHLIASNVRSFKRKSANRLLSLSLVTIATAVVCSGCFVVRREQFSKPVGPADSVRFHRIAAGCESYSRVIDTNQYSAQVSVANWPSGWELQFLFNIIPIGRHHYGKTEPLSVEIEVEPRNPELAVDSNQIFLVGEGRVRLPPAKAHVLGRSSGSPPEQPVPVTNCTTFRLEFPVEHFAYPEHDAPFQLSLEGFTIAGRSISVPLITFEPELSTGPGFRLPY